MITWLLEKDLWPEENQEMKKAVKENGLNWREVEYIPFTNQDYSNIQGENEICVFHGSLLLAKKLRPYVRGVFCDLAQFECTNYYNYLGEFLLNYDYIMFPFGELKRNKQRIFDLILPNTPDCHKQLFVRPSSGNKLFTGQVISFDDFDTDFKLLNFYDVDNNAIIVISTVKRIIKEWRVVICDGNPIACSLYKENNKLVSREEWPIKVINFANTLSKIWEPEETYTMDIAETEQQNEKTYSLIEINSFSCSGLYNCNKAKIVYEVSKLLEK